MSIISSTIKRPVLTTVLSLLLILFGFISYTTLPLRELPDINPPVVSVETLYRGASAEIIDREITEKIEDRISGIEGIDSISSESSPERSQIVIEFNLERDIDAALNDVRDRVSRVISLLPNEADTPEVSKTDANTREIMWLTINSDSLSDIDLSDYADRFLIDQFSTIDGVARARIGGGRLLSLRIWLNPTALAARGLSALDVENQLRLQNIELPAGRIESTNQEYSIRLPKLFKGVEDFESLIIQENERGITRLKDVADVKIGAENYRSLLRANGRPTIGIGISKQAKANTLSVSQKVKAKMADLQSSLPKEIRLEVSYDQSIYIEASIKEVYKTLLIVMLVVITVIVLFLGNIQYALVPAVTVPISLLASFTVLNLLDYSVNLLTLLALILAVGLVVDDAIVVLENIYRRAKSGEKLDIATLLGTEQVGFAVIATSIVLISVFVPITFLTGNVARLFSEFAITLCAAVFFSTFIALTLSPVMTKYILKHNKDKRFYFTQIVDQQFSKLKEAYTTSLEFLFEHPKRIFITVFILLILIFGIFKILPKTLTPTEDRGVFFVFMSAPQGASFDYTDRYMSEVEQPLLELLENNEARRVIIRLPGSFSSTGEVNSGLSIILLKDWAERERTSKQIAFSLMPKFMALPGARAFPILPRFGQRGFTRPIAFVLQGSEYEALNQDAEKLIDALSKYKNITQIDKDYKETTPQKQIYIDLERAKKLKVNNKHIGETLEILLGSKKVTTFTYNGQEYDVILQLPPVARDNLNDFEEIYIKNEMGESIPLENLIHIEETATSNKLNRFNRLKAITISAQLRYGAVLGDTLNDIETIAKETLGNDLKYDFKGSSRELKKTNQGMIFLFITAFIIIYLVLAAQFESFLYPLVILITLPLALFGALWGLFITGISLNIYSQVALLILLGVVAKNGILIVEFINQIIAEHKSKQIAYRIEACIIKACQTRLRPILMTSFSSIIGALPLVFATGAGSESRQAIGTVILFGLGFSVLITLFVIPIFYRAMYHFNQRFETIE